MSLKTLAPLGFLRDLPLWRWGPFALAFIYAVASGLYIWLSSTIVRREAGGDTELMLRWELLKGFGFVLFSAALLYVLLAMVARTARAKERVTAELRQAHDRLKLLVEGNPHFFFYTQDIAGKVTYVSPTVEQITGRAPEEWLGQSHWFVTDNPINEEAKRRTHRHLTGRFEDKPILVEIAHPSGRRVLLEAFEAPLVVNGQLVGIQGVAHDVTARSRGELLKEFFLHVSAASSSARSREELFAHVHSELARLLPVPNFFVALWDGESKVIEFPYFRDEKDPPPGPQPPGKGLTEYVIRTRRPLLLDPQRRAQLLASGEVEPVGSPAHCWMGAPMIADGRPLGALVVQSYRQEVRYFEEDLEALAVAAQQVAQVLHRWSLERELAEALAHFRALVELSPDAILIHQDGVIRFANPAAARLWGATEIGDLVGKPVTELVAPSSLEVVRQRVQKSLQDGVTAPPLVEEFVRLDGTRFYGEASAVPVTYDGRPAIEVVIRDVSERERVEAMVRHAQKMEAIGTLAGGVAHDFNNILQAFSAILFSLRQSTSQGRDPRHEFEKLEELVQRGTALARQLLLFARRELAKRELLDLNGVVAEVYQFFHRLLPENIHCRLELAPEPVVVEGDRGQLHQVILNLVLNARDAMPEGGTIWVRTELRDQEAVVSVTDTGAGIPEEIRHRIFDPFFTTKGPEKGSGLGLAVVHGIATQHGGRVEVVSEVGQGSTFSVFLPRASGQLTTKPWPGTDDALPAGKGQRLLLVEDEAVARESLAQVLQSLGYLVTAVASAEEAVLLPEEPKYDLLLTDFLLPGASGVQLAAQLVDRWPNLKLVVMSGYAQDQVLKERVWAGKIRFLQKPFTVEHLARELALALQAQGQEDRA